MWTIGPNQIDPAATWPAPIIESIVTSFCAPGSRVLLAPWPAGEIGTSDMTGDSELAAARDAVRAAGRDVAVAQLVVARSPNASSAGDATCLCGTTAHDEHAELDDGEQPCPEATEQVDLIVTALPADRRNDPSIEAVALAAARRLTFGGIFAVYTHGDWTTGRLHDPSRLVIAAAQNADLLYLQHIVTLHTPIRNGRLQPPAASVRLLEDTAVRRDVGSPTSHVRVHGDVLVFAQAHADAGQPEELR
uniref:Uncharacterized protein n=1 Tax=Amycolatopsis sp. SANK 60206 TaxID=1642649 RepID=A0A0E3USB9_9PSEU|nr:hypothetical protein [Amycolatopsis sp. SANK 60206]